MNDQALQERINIFTPEYRKFLASDFISETTVALAEEEGLDEVQLRLFQDAIGLYLLCFLDIEETITFISSQAGLSTELTRGMVGAVLSTLPSEVVTALEIVFSALNDPQDGGGEANVPDSPNQPVSPVRTMENDMAAAQEGQTYASSQDALLKNKAGEVPKPNVPPQA